MGVACITQVHSRKQATVVDFDKRQKNEIKKSPNATTTGECEGDSFKEEGS